MKHTTIIIAALLLFVACGQSYEETKRISREQRREAMRLDSAALKIAVLPTLDCLPLFVAEQEHLLDTLNGGVRLKMYQAQMDCDTALERKRVEGMVTDLVRAVRINNSGTKIRYVAVTNAYWQLIGNRRYSLTDMLCDRVADSVKIPREHLFKVQLNDIKVRMLMLQNNEIDALWLTEPQATMARLYKNPVIYDSREDNLQPGILAFREKEMRRPERAKQLVLLVDAYNKACDLINEHGLQHYRDLIMERCQITANVADSLPAGLKFLHAQGPREEDIKAVEAWLETLKEKK